MAAPPTIASREICHISTSYAPVIPISLNIFESPFMGQVAIHFLCLKMSDIDCNNLFWSEACTCNYCDKQETVTQKAGILMAIPFIVTVMVTFLFGNFGVDWAGLRTEMLVLSPSLLVVAHSLFLFQQSSPVVPLLLLGLGYSMSVAAIWPSVPLAVMMNAANAAGTAIGIMCCCAQSYVGC